MIQLSFKQFASDISWRGLSLPERFGLACALMILLWSPFSGGPRLFVALLGVMGARLLWKQFPGILGNRECRRLGLVFLALWLPMISALPCSVNPENSLKYILITPIYFVAGVGLLFTLNSSRKRDWLALALALLLMLWVVDALIQYLFGRDLFGIPMGVESRVTGMFEDNLRLGIFLPLFAPMLINELQRRGAGRIGLAMFMSLTIVVFLGGSRSAMLMAILAGIAILVSLQFRHKLKIALVILVCGLLAVTTSPIIQHKFEQTRSNMELSFDKLDLLLSGRLLAWETAGQMAFRNTWTGVGTGNFEEAYPDYATRENDIWLTQRIYHAHQAYVSVAAESGLPGLLGLLTIWGLCLKWYYAVGKAQRSRAWPYAAGLVVALFPINSQPVLFTNWYFPILLLLMALLLSTLAGESPDEESETA